MPKRKTEDDEARKGAADEPNETKKVAPRMVVLTNPEPEEEEPAPRPNMEARVVPWNGPKPDERPPSIGSMQPPGK